MNPVDWDSPDWGVAGKNIHEATGGGMDAETADE